jgi:two-component system, OmpR family, sensor histidine kinase PhoQ
MILQSLHYSFKNPSLKKRLGLVSALVILLSFYIVYLITKNAYINANKTNIHQSLNAQLYALMAVADEQDAQLILPNSLKNDRLNHLNSGLVAYVLDIDGDLIWRSASSDSFGILPDISLSYSINKLTESMFEQEMMFWVGDKITWEHENGLEGEYLFLIGEKQSAMLLQVNEYKRTIATWLWLSTVILLMVLVLALNLSLSPLKDAQIQIELVSKGDIDKVEGDFPAELIPLTSSINKLLVSEGQQKTRYRNSLGNLAHSLKTPLAVIKSELQHQAESESKQQLIKQVERIDDIVKYQLNRAVISPSQTLIRQWPIATEVAKIVDALNKIHAAKNIQVSADIPTDCYFPGDKGDFLELLGNLSDNACKWAKQQVKIQAQSSNNQLELSVIDDGPGIPEDKRALILDRGKRLDQLAEGQGLGLSIVMDIIQNYNAEMSIGDSDLGGSIFTIKIPLPSE